MASSIFEVSSSSSSSSGEGQWSNIWVPTAFWSAGVVVVLFSTSKLFSPLLFTSYSKLNRDDKLDWDSKYASTIHAILISLLAPIAILNWRGEQSKSVPITIWQSPLTNLSLGVSMGYFVADTVLVVKYYPTLGDFPMAIHHCVATMAVVFALTLGQCHIYALTSLATECTTPSINLRWFLAKAGLEKSGLYLANGLLMMFSWVVMRILLFVFFFLNVLENWEDVSKLPRFASSLVVSIPPVLLVLNIFWFTKIVKGALKCLKNQGKES